MCTICGRKVPYSIVIDGKRHSLGSRKQCTDCVPIRKKNGQVYTEELLHKVVQEALSYAEVLRLLGRPQSGSFHFYIKGLVQKFKIDDSHFTGKFHRRGQTAFSKRPWQEVLVTRTSDRVKESIGPLRRAMVESGLLYICSECKLGPSWNSKVLRLQVDHIDGNGWDNRRQNVRFLCPNCHAQTNNFGSRNSARFKQNAVLAPTKSISLEVPKTQRICSSCSKPLGTTTKGSLCKVCYLRAPHVSARKVVERPSKEVLVTQVAELGYEGTGRLYKVTGALIKRWLIWYGVKPEPRLQFNGPKKSNNLSTEVIKSHG